MIKIIATYKNLPIPKIPITPESLIGQIKEVSGIDILNNNNRLRCVVACKALFAIKMKELIMYNLSETGRFIKKDHSTILYYRNSYKGNDYFDSLKKKLGW